MNNNYNRGVTYVEIIISLLIFAMIIPMLINVFQFAKVESKRSREMLQLPYIGQAYMEELISAPVDRIIESQSSNRVEYGGYFFDHYITTYWNGNIGVLYYVVGQIGESYSIDVYGCGEGSSYTIVNAMKYELDQDVYIEGLHNSNLDNIIIYCTDENLERIHIDGIDNATIILNNSSRERIMFKLNIDIFGELQDVAPILSMETLFEKEI